MSTDNMRGDFIDGTQADGTLQVTDANAATALAQAHPKSLPVPAHRFGMALDPVSTGEGEIGIGVGGALPIGAFVS